MADRVELVFKRERSPEKPRELIVRYLSTVLGANGGEVETWPEGRVLPDVLEGERFYGAYRKTFYLSAPRLVIRDRRRGWCRVLEHRWVDRVLIELEKAPDPGPLWPLLDMLRRRTERDRRFSGPPHLGRLVRRLTPALRKAFGLEPRADLWQAALTCPCGSDRFGLTFVGSVDRNGLLCDLPGHPQRSELVCSRCGKTTPLFDPAVNGYDAAVCDFRSKQAGPRPAPRAFACRCQGAAFRAAVSVVYDAEPDTLADLTARQRNESYGWFTATVKCGRCGRRSEFVDYECA